MFYGTYCGVFLLIGFEYFGLVLFFNVDFRCAEGILGTTLAQFGFFGLVLFFIVDFRCAEGILGTILVDFGFLGLALFLLRMPGVLKAYLVILNETTRWCMLCSTLFHCDDYRLITGLVP